MTEDNEFESAFSTGQELESPIFSGRAPKAPRFSKSLKLEPEKMDAKGFKRGLLLAFIGVVGVTVLIALLALLVTNLT